MSQGIRAVHHTKLTNAVLSEFFADGGPTRMAEAPGRLDVMGGIADYSGSLVLQLPLDRTTRVIAQGQPALAIDILTVRNDESHRPAGIGLNALVNMPPEDLAALFPPESNAHWASYVLGVAYACLVRNAHRMSDPMFGIRLLITSEVPEGKGVSSSAALEVACLAAIAAVYKANLSPEEIAAECQWAENHIAGAPCGIMDQMTSALGRENHLLKLRCQPAIVEGHVAIPEGYNFFGIDSGIRHAVTGADYRTVRTAAFMGYRMIASLAGLAVTSDGDRVNVDDHAWHGYLANISPNIFNSRFEHHLPEQMLGADFLAQFHGITDTVTRVNPGVTYPVRQATAHPIHENARVEQFASLLDALTHSRAHAEELGELMYASHESYTACGLGSDGTDRLVQMVKDAGPSQGLFGAKITGGGSGGTVAIFADASAEPVVRDIKRRYEEETGRVAELFTGSGPGMAAVGVKTLAAIGIGEAP